MKRHRSFLEGSASRSKNGLEARHAYRISKWLQLVFEVQDYD